MRTTETEERNPIFREDIEEATKLLPGKAQKMVRVSKFKTVAVRQLQTIARIRLAAFWVAVAFNQSVYAVEANTIKARRRDALALERSLSAYCVYRT
jgi:hypothetical protein